VNKAVIKKITKTIIKIAVSVAAIALVVSKINISSTAETICSAQWQWIIGALLIYATSQVLSAMRINAIFKVIPFKLNSIVNLRLYWLGMFYNFFLPGGVGGDGYKIYYLHKHYKQSVKQLTTSIVCDRLSGLIAISCYLLAFISALGSNIGIPYCQWAFILIPLGSLAYRIFLSIFAKFVLVVRHKVLCYSGIIQGMQMMAAMFILFAIGADGQIAEYLFLFFVSSIASAIPISMGGIGLRELTFVMGSQYFGTNEDIAVSLSILFYTVSLISALPGAIFAFKTSLIGADNTNAENE